MLAGAGTDSVATQHMGQASFGGRFEQSGSKVPVNFDDTADQAFRKLVELPLRGCLRWRLALAVAESEVSDGAGSFSKLHYALRLLRGCSLSVTLFSTH